MKLARRSVNVLSLLAIVFAGCFGDKPAPAQNQGAPPENRVAKMLDGLRVVPPSERPGPDGKTYFAVGRLEAAIPPGWSTLRIAGQTKYMGPGGQESIQVFAYTSEAAMDETRQHEVLAALNQIGATGEHVIGRFAHVTLSQPTEGKTPWGSDIRFSAIGPMNRMAFHYATAGAHEAVMVQMDGNNLENTPAHAVALIKSFRYLDDKPAR